MKSIILLLIGTGLAFFGLTVEGLFVELAGMITGVMVLTEVWNKWLDLHKWKAVLSTIGMSIVVGLVGFLFIENSFLYRAETMVLVENIVIIALAALGLWPNFKKAVESV